MRFSSRREIQINKKKWDFIAKGQGRGSVDGKLIRGNIRGKELFWLN